MAIRCQVCRQKVSVLTASHLAKHHLTTAGYRHKYPDAPFFSPTVLEKLNSEETVKAKRRGQRSRSAKNRREAGRKIAAAWTPARRKEQGQRIASRNFDWWQDQAYRMKMCQVAREATTIRSNTPEHKRQSATRMVRLNRDPQFQAKRITALKRVMRTPEYRAKLTPVFRWTKPECQVRRWLRAMGIYRTGSEDQVGFLPHGWLPSKKLAANCDFIDYNHGLIIHVDGVYWHNGTEGTEHDHQVDRWCCQNGWLFLRLTDLDVTQKPKLCKRMIRRLVRGRVVPCLRGV